MRFESFQLAATVIIFQPILNLLTQCISNIRWEHVIDTDVPFAPPLNVVVGDEENCWHMSSGHFSHLVFYTRTHLLVWALINHKLVIRYTWNQNRYVITYMFMWKCHFLQKLSTFFISSFFPPFWWLECLRCSRTKNDNPCYFNKIWESFFLKETFSEGH